MKKKIIDTTVCAAVARSQFGQKRIPDRKSKTAKQQDKTRDDRLLQNIPKRATPRRANWSDGSARTVSPFVRVETHNGSAPRNESRRKCPGTLIFDATQIDGLVAFLLRGSRSWKRKQNATIRPSEIAVLGKRYLVALRRGKNGGPS